MTTGERSARVRRGAAGTRAARSLLLPALLATACSGERVSRSCPDLSWSGPAPGAPLVLLLNDTMRRDRVGAYGGPARTPVFDRLARESLLFERASTQAPWTMPAVATLFTSLFPSQHKVLAHPQFAEQPEADPLPPELVTLAERLAAAGYRTGAFVSNPWMERRFGFDQGFATYEDGFARWDADGIELSEAALAWLDRVPRGEPFFLYVHYIDSHQPYPALGDEALFRAAERVQADRRPLTPFARTAIPILVRLESGVDLERAGLEPSLALLELAYDEGLAQFDRALERFLTGFESHWGFAQAALIVTSDHGEALFERGYGGHGQGLHEDELAVPLVARLPGVSGRNGRVGCQVGLIDLVPTLCAYLGLPCPDATFGTSLLAGSGEGRDVLLAEGVGGRPRNRSVRDAGYKLIWQPDGAPDGSEPDPPYSLYRLADDPGEARDLLAGGPPGRLPVFARLQRELHQALPEVGVAPGPRVPIAGDLEQRLRSLGYVE